MVYYHTHSKNIDNCGKIPRVPVENQITTLSVVKIAIKLSPCRLCSLRKNNKLNKKYEQTETSHFEEAVTKGCIIYGCGIMLLCYFFWLFFTGLFSLMLFRHVLFCHCVILLGYFVKCYFSVCYLDVIWDNHN